MTIGSLRLGKMIKLLLRMSITNGIGFFDWSLSLLNKRSVPMKKPIGIVIFVLFTWNKWPHFLAGNL
jgi:hypothetical protein